MSTEILFSKIQEFMNISLSDNIRYYNQSSVIVSCSLYQYQCQFYIFSISSNINII